MQFVPTPLSGLYVAAIELHQDARGSFGRAFCQSEFAAAGLSFEIVQANVSLTAEPATLRGLHYQADPYGEPKLVRCTRGRIFDVAVDLRSASPTHRRWFGIELSPDDPRMLFIPEGFAHGFVTLEPRSEVSYLMGARYVPEAARGVRWNDPAFGIEWPVVPRHMSARDAGYSDYGQGQTFAGAAP